MSDIDICAEFREALIARLAKLSLVNNRAGRDIAAAEAQIVITELERKHGVTITLTDFDAGSVFPHATLEVRNQGQEDYEPPVPDDTPF